MDERRAPSSRVMVYFVNENSHNNIIEPKSTERSTRLIPCMFMGEITPVTPKISKMLNTFEPNTLPMAMPLLPLRAATALVASSGCDVPPATMVSPITASLMPMALATVVAPSTKRLLPSTNQPKPTSNQAVATRGFIGFFASVCAPPSGFAVVRVMPMKKTNKISRKPASTRPM